MVADCDCRLCNPETTFSMHRAETRDLARAVRVQLENVTILTSQTSSPGRLKQAVDRAWARSVTENVFGSGIRPEEEKKEEEEEKEWPIQMTSRLIVRLDNLQPVHLEKCRARFGNDVESLSVVEVMGACRTSHLSDSRARSVFVPLDYRVPVTDLDRPGRRAYLERGMTWEEKTPEYLIEQPDVIDALLVDGAADAACANPDVMDEPRAAETDLCQSGQAVMSTETERSS